MKKLRDRTKDKKILIGVALLFPIIIPAWGEYLFKNVPEILAIIITALAFLSVIIGLYILITIRIEEDEKNKEIIATKTFKDGKIVDKKEPTDEKKEKVSLFYKIPYNVMFNGLFFLWAIAGGFIAEYSETSVLLKYFPSKNFLMGMLLAIDAIVCLAIWFLYMGYFHSKNKRTLFLVLIVVIYMVFYLYLKQYE